MAKDNRPDLAAVAQGNRKIAKGERHPLFGALKGTMFVPPGVDLTEPADPDWGKVYEE